MYACASYASNACEGHKRASNPVNWSYRWLSATTWMLGNEPGSGRASVALNQSTNLPSCILNINITKLCDIVRTCQSQVPSADFSLTVSVHSEMALISVDMISLITAHQLPLW